MDFPGVRFYPLCSNETTSLKNDTFIWIRIHILHLVYTTSLSDLCFNKKIDQEKKSLYKSISKSIFLILIIYYFVIIVSKWMWCLVTFNKIFFLTSQKGNGIANINYLKMKNDSTYWNTIIHERNQIHAASNFLLLSS